MEEARCTECNKLLFKYGKTSENPEGSIRLKRPDSYSEPMILIVLPPSGHDEFDMEIKCPRCGKITGGKVTVNIETPEVPQVEASGNGIFSLL